VSFDLAPWVPGLYESIHRHPELAGRETRTAGLCADRLEAAGFAVQRGVGGTGVLAHLDRGDGPVVLARAELDALALSEATQADFASEVDGVMHACGHDLHLAALVAAAARIAQESPRGQLVVVLQPAEEAGTGAAAMLSDGLAARIPRPDVLLAQHVSHLAPVGVLASTAGVALAASDSFVVRVTGTGGHSSAPGAGVDPVLFAAALTQRVHTVVGHDLAPFDQAVVSVPSIDASSAPGVRAQRAEVTINVRTFAAHVREVIERRIAQLVRAEAAAHDLIDGTRADVVVEHVSHVPATVNDREALERVAGAHRGVRLAHLAVPPALASDDVSVLAQGLECPCAYWFIGSGEPGSRLGTVRPGCHTDRFLPHPTTLAVAATSMHAAITASLSGA
jgi:amidohydrolase